jgi:hypothetical protein
MSCWWCEFSERLGYPHGSIEFAQYLSEVSGWSKEQVTGFMKMYLEYQNKKKIIALKTNAGEEKKE